LVTLYHTDISSNEEVDEVDGAISRSSDISEADSTDLGDEVGIDGDVDITDDEELADCNADVGCD